MDKLLYALIGALFVGFGFYGIFSAETGALLGASIADARIISFETDPIEYSIQLVICFVFGIILIYSAIFDK